MKKILIAISLIFIISASYMSYQIVQSKKVLTSYLNHLNNLEFEKANSLLKIKKKYPKDIPNDVLKIFKKITKNNTYTIELESLKGLDLIVFNVKEKNMLIFDIVKNYRNESNEEVDKINEQIFDVYLEEIKKHEEYYESKQNRFVLHKEIGIWRITPQK